MRYFRRAWEEPRGDEHNDWGASVWYFAIGDDGYASRQLEVYASGEALAYDENHVEDDFGALSEPHFDDLEWARFEITAAEFERAWDAARPRNRPNATL